MAQQKGIIDWEAVGRVEDLRGALPFIPIKDIIDYLGPDYVVRELVKRLTPKERAVLLNDLARRP